MTDDDLPPLKELLKHHNLWAKKSFGQNFLFDLNVTRKIARLANARPGVHFVEIGPGPGGLTRGLLLEGVDQLTAIERDKRMAPILSQISEHYPNKLNVLFEDALSFEVNNLSSQPTEIVGNLPYNIGTVLLTNWLEQPWPPNFAALTLMFQQEVAERIVSRPRCKPYGRISALSQWRCDVEIVYRLPREAFTPPPKIASAVVRFHPKASLGLNPPVQTFSKVTAAAFGQRRKMLRQSLKSICSDVAGLLDSVGLDPTLRAEELDWLDYCRIALKLDEI